MPSMIEFLAWKEKLEETTNTCYVKTQQTYCHPILESMHFALIALVPVYQYHFSTITAIKERLFYVCCRSGKYKENVKPRISSKQRIYQKDSRKINGTCLSRKYVDNFEDGHVEVEYISAHTAVFLIRLYGAPLALAILHWPTYKQNLAPGWRSAI